MAHVRGDLMSIPTNFEWNFTMKKRGRFGMGSLFGNSIKLAVSIFDWPNFVGIFNIFWLPVETTNTNVIQNHRQTKMFTILKLFNSIPIMVC